MKSKHPYKFIVMDHKLIYFVTEQKAKMCYTETEVISSLSMTYVDLSGVDPVI